MSQTRTQAARLVATGSVIVGSSTVEIWSSGTWLAPFSVQTGQPQDDDFSSLNADDYLTNHALPVWTKLAGYFPSEYRLDSLKLNRFHVERRTTPRQPNGAWASIQTEQQTHALYNLNVQGQGGSTPFPFDTCQGVTFLNKGVTRGRASLSRMFLPPLGTAYGQGRFGSGTTSGSPKVQVVGTFLHDLANIVTTSSQHIYPAIVSLPPKKNGQAEPKYLVNKIESLIVEDIPFVQRRRKNALKGGGVRADATYDNEE